MRNRESETQDTDGSDMWRDDRKTTWQRMRRMAVGARGRGRLKRIWIDCLREGMRVVSVMEEESLDGPPLVTSRQVGFKPLRKRKIPCSMLNSRYFREIYPYINE